MTNPAPNGPTPNLMPGAQGAAAAPLDPAAPNPAAPQLPTGAPAPAPAPAPPAGQQPEAPKPPWEASGEPFDPERAWGLIQNLRTENTDYKGKLADVQPILDAQEQQRRAEQGEAATLREDLAKSAQRGDSWRDRAIRSEARILADDRFIDADAALALIGDLSAFATEDGVDAASLQQRFDKLAEDKPHLVATVTPPRPGFTPNRGQGQPGAAPATIDAQIQAAQARGDFVAAIALKQHKHNQ